MGPLTTSDLGQFAQRGWCRLPRAFSGAQARAVQEVVWEHMRDRRGIERDDPTTWPQAEDLQRELDGEPKVIDAFTPAIGLAIEQIVGVGRWCGVRRWGFWPVSFTYAKDEPEAWPHWGWHVDGNWFRHTLDCPKQGLLVIGLFTDVPPGSGGTVVAEGSHRRAARVLAAHPGGLAHRELFDRVLAEPIGNFTELTGCAGDVVLAHPFLFHTRGCKRHGPPRILSNVEAPLREPMRFDRADGEHSVLERSILDALGGHDEPPVVGPRRCRF